MSSNIATRRLTFLVWIVVVVLGVTGVVQLRHRAAHPTVPGNSIDPPYVPYTVVMSNTTRDGNRTLEDTFAVSANGDYVELKKGIKRDLGYRNQFVRRTVATGTGLIIRIDDVAELRSTTYDPTGSTRIRLGDPKYDCMKTKRGAPLRLYERQVIKRELIAGYETLAVRGNRTTLWYAPTLNCAILKATTVFSPDQVYEESLVSVTAGEPSPTLLTVPAHYEEVPPSGIEKTNSSVINDKYYYAHRPPAHLIAGDK